LTTDWALFLVWRASATVRRKALAGIVF